MSMLVGFEYSKVVTDAADLPYHQAQVVTPLAAYKKLRLYNNTQ